MEENKKTLIGIVGGTIALVIFVLLIKLGVLIFILWVVYKLLQHFAVI